MFINQKDMILYILSNRTISDVQQDFNKAYPFLKIEFYKNIEPGFSRKHLQHSTNIKAAGLKTEGHLEIADKMTVGQLENTFKEKFGLSVQVSRKSGILWLETTMTDNWTLKQQNDHGRELSQYEKPEIKDIGLMDND
jgi:hypothetical protein